MNVTIGKYSLTLARGQERTIGANRATSPPPPDAPVLISMDQPRSSFITNPWDHPRQNIQFIRETVSACMHARSEALSKGRFHAYAVGHSHPVGHASSLAHGHRTSGSAAADCPTLLPGDHPLERLLQNPNPLFDLSDLLELSSQWLDATGNALWLKVRNGHGDVIELWPVAALSFIIERGSDQLPAAYRFLPANAIIPASDII